MKHTTVIFITILLFTACSSSTATPSALPGGPRAWIDAPLDGSQLPPAPLEIVSHTTDVAHIAQVELSVNGSAVRSDPNPDSSQILVTMRQTWMPPGPGNYTLMVRAQNSTGAWGDYAKAVITIAGGGVVQGVVYSDPNGNGLPNFAGDAPLDGVVVTLSGCASQTATTVNGAFQFTGLPTGNCLVQVSKPGWKFSGIYPSAFGYPARVASDPGKPTAFSFYMTPLITPASVVTPSQVPTLTPTATAAPSSTSTPTALPPISITFYADQTSLVSGQCTTIHWQVTNASQIFVDNASAPASGSQQDCPTQTTAHSLRVITLDNQNVQRTVAITVVPPSLTPTQPPTFTPTLPPIILRPTFTPTPVGCSGTPAISYFTASPQSVTLGGTSRLSWGVVTNADSVYIDQGIGGVGTPGSTIVTPSNSTRYTLTAFCGRNMARAWVTVVVTIPAPQ